jgi:uncharacterized damage-inducible protein DinB
MIPLATLQELYAYNYWARDRQLEACAALSQEQFLRPMGNSFSSLRDTLAHLVAAEWIWSERWRGNSPKALLTASDFPDLATVKERWRGTEDAVREVLAGLNEDALAAPLHYINTRGQAYTYPLWRSMMHVINHQTYHRGQVTMFLRQLGLEAPALDLLIADDAGLFPAGPAYLEKRA